MSCCTHVWQPRGVHKLFRGTVTGADFRSSVDRSTASPDFEGVQYVINDFTACDVGRLTRGDFAYLAAIADAYYPRLAPQRVAFVTTDARVGADIRDTLRDLEQRCSVRVFGDLDSAQAWYAVEEAKPRMHGAST